VYTVNKTTAATQIAALQTMAMEEGKDMVLSVTLKAASSGSAFAAMYKAARQSYQSLAQGTIDPLLGRGGAASEMKATQKDRATRRVSGDRETDGYITIAPVQYVQAVPSLRSGDH
jgi:hypothetical protein